MLTLRRATITVCLVSVVAFASSCDFLDILRAIYNNAGFTIRTTKSYPISGGIFRIPAYSGVTARFINATSGSTTGSLSYFFFSSNQLRSIHPAVVQECRHDGNFLFPSLSV